MSFLTCIKSLEGISLFTRASRDSKNIPSTIIGTLNNIFTFGDNYGVKLHSTDSENFKIIWKIFHSNLTLILIEPIAPVEEQVYFDKINVLFDTLVFMYGLDDLINITNIEKFKNEIKMSYRILDTILDTGRTIELFGGYLTDSIDSIITKESDLFQSTLNESCVSINTSYACLMMNGKIIVASTAWWELNPNESYLISLLCLTLSNCTIRDIPIYLPYKNPHQALRLLTFNLLSSNNVVLCFICSEKPTVDDAQMIVKKFWHPIYKSIINLKQYLPRNLPITLSLDNNMIAFLLINKKNKCCSSSICPNEKTAINFPREEIKNRYDLLKYFYLNISSNFFKKYVKGKTKTMDEDEERNESTSCLETYLLFKEYKCYALNETLHEFYAVFNNNIPTYALRGVTKTCFNILLNL